MGARITATYLLPIRSDNPVVTRTPGFRELIRYLAWLTDVMTEVLVVDGSPSSVFEQIESLLPERTRHIGVARSAHAVNGKAAGVMAGLSAASYARVIIADDDVRYRLEELARVAALLEHAELVRPQNYFDPCPWHARWDTARMLLNRFTGDDWPGTLAVRRETVLAGGGYDVTVLFENLELERTVRALGGRTLHVPSCYVRRLPPSTSRFVEQRVRQAYDEFARPHRLVAQLAILPLISLAIARRHSAWLIVAALALIGAAEIGRRRDRGAGFFPKSAPLFAPAWLLERGICSWLALGSRVVRGGIRYRGTTLRCAANNQRALDRRAGVRRQEGDPVPAPSTIGLRHDAKNQVFSAERT